MATSFPDLTFLTQGMLTDGRGLSGTAATGGLPTFLDPPPPASQFLAIPPVVSNLPPGSGFTPEQLSYIQNSPPIANSDGHLIVPSAFGMVDLGSGYNMSFDPDTLQGRITPAFASQALDSLHEAAGGAMFTYSGADCKAVIEFAEQPSASLAPRFSKQIIELTTISISIHRVKSQVSAWGFINPKGIARGRRTIAGTMVMTKFTAEVLMRFLQAGVVNDQSKDSHYMKIDQLPPFNISLIFTNEYGFASYQRILGVEFVTEANIYSVQDMLTEQSITYLAKDFTPLLPLNLSSFYHPAVSSPSTAKERTVQDVWGAGKLTTGI